MSKPKSVPVSTSEPKPPESKPHQSWLARLLAPKKARLIIGLAALIVVIAALLAVPYTRYAILGQVAKRSVVVEITDSRTHKPVSDAVIEINGKKLKTDAKGKVSSLSLPVGGRQFSVNKKYYDLLTADIMVPLFGQLKPYKFELAAIGKHVTVKVTNKLTGQPLAKASIAALGTTATTDASGEAVIVLPVKRPQEPGTVKLAGYNDLAVSIQNSENLTAANTFAATPSGKIYFLSKRTGKINVMKSDLDGGNASIVVAGTGKEADYDTVLLATRDWKYLALKAKRDDNPAKLYIIDTATDKLAVMDEGKASFTPIGWEGHQFVFTLTRNDVENWQPKQSALKAYNAEKDTLATLDQTEGEGNDQYYYITQSLNNIYLVDGSVIYTKQWNISAYGQQLYNGKKLGIYSSSLSTGARKTLKDFDARAGLSLNGTLYEPKEPVFQLNDYASGTSVFSYYEVENGKAAATTSVNAETFNQSYPTYIQSPSGKQTFWFESRDGKNTIFSGDNVGKGGKELATLSEFTPYGWYSEDYILLSKKGSELYITSKDLKQPPFKVTDYHRPGFNSNGYGGGYGGF